jgi:hypothetical protein
MHPEIARVLAEQRHHELIRLAGQRRAAASLRRTRRHAPGWRVSWSHATLSPVDAAGRGGRSWVIVISATRGF